MASVRLGRRRLGCADSLGYLSGDAMRLHVANKYAVSRLAKHMVERTHRSTTPAPAITAPIPDDVPRDPDKGLLAQRDAYFAQSKATRDNVVAPFQTPAAEQQNTPPQVPAAGFSLSDDAE